jgi:hypothetical protein
MKDEEKDREYKASEATVHSRLCTQNKYLKLIEAITSQAIC